MFLGKFSKDSRAEKFGKTSLYSRAGLMGSEVFPELEFQSVTPVNIFDLILKTQKDKVAAT